MALKGHLVRTDSHGSGFSLNIPSDFPPRGSPTCPIVTHGLLLPALLLLLSTYAVNGLASLPGAQGRNPGVVLVSPFILPPCCSVPGLSVLPGST